MGPLVRLFIINYIYMAHMSVGCSLQTTQRQRPNPVTAEIAILLSRVVAHT